MRRLSCLFAALLLGALLVVPPSHAQTPFSQDNIDNIGDLRGALRAATSEYADSYVQPLTNVFGAGMNGGLFRSADVGDSLIPGFPINVYLGLNVSSALTSSLDKRFVPPQQIPIEATAPSGAPQDVEAFIEFVPQGDTDVPTAAGDTEPPSADLDLVFRNGGADGPVATNPQTGEELRTTLGNPPQGLVRSDVPATPLPLPQLGVGSIAGTDLQLRYFPTSKVAGYGQIGLFGLAVRHDLDQWIPAPLPLNIAVQGAYNRFSLSSQDPIPGAASTGFREVLDASGWAFNLQASKGVPILPLQFYGGLQYETFNVDYSYAFDVSQFAGDASVDPVAINLSQDAVNSVRGIVGFTLTFAIVRFNVDYAISENNVVTTGLGVRL